MSEGFVFGPVDKGQIDPLMLFWRVVRRYRIDTEKERVTLLRKLVKRNQIRYLPHPEESLKGRNVLDLRAKEHNDNGTL